MQSQRQKIFVIDGSSFLYRAYYAMKPMHTPQGVSIGAVYGFCRMIKKLIDNFQPTHLIIAWDSPGTTERHTLLPSYKGKRQAPPNDLFTQKKLIKQIGDAIGIYQVEQPGIEADDLMYSIAQDFIREDFEVVIVTTDKDLGQAVTGNIIVVYDPFKEETFNEEGIAARYSFPANKLPFYFSLIGDSSDNIPGVAGIGPKTAVELVKQFTSLEDLYAHLEHVTKDRTRELLRANKENAFLSQQLFLLRYYELNIMPAMCQFNAAQWTQARQLFQELNFKSFLKDIPAAPPVPLSQRHGFNFECITSRENLTKICQEIRFNGFCALDTETNSLFAYQAKLVGISLCYKGGTAYYIPLSHTTSTDLTQEDIFHILKPLLEDASILKYLHNAKFDQLALSRYGIELEGVSFDTLIAAGLVTPDGQKLGLKALSSSYLQQTMFSYAEIMAMGKFKDFSELPLDIATEYAASDAHQTFQLVPLLQERLITFQQEELFKKIEMPLSQTLYRMEKEGIIIDASILTHMNTEVMHQLDTIREHIIALLGEEYTKINLNSPRQVEEILFTKLQLTPTKKTDKKTGYSTDQEVLSELAQQHPIPALIIKYRELYKLKSTYLDTLPTYINPFTNRIHTSFKQSATATGRLASADPNLQNIPVASVTDHISIRSAFKAPADHLFISSDYSQIELRVLAYFSQDQRLLEAFTRNEDIHARTAAGLFETSLEQVTHEQRQIGKRINFSILYGLTPYGLSKDLGISYNQAEGYIERYFAQYPGVSQWMKSVIEETKQLGYVTTYWGRRRYIPGIYEKNRSLYELAQRVAINTKAQGTAAEIMKIGMNQLETHFKAEKKNAKIILQIHDELLIAVPKENIAQIEPVVVNILQNVVSWNIPLIVTTRTGKNWGDVTK